MISAALGARAWRRLAPLVLIVGLVTVGLFIAALTASRAVARTADGDGVIYNGGAVITHNTIYVVWWGGGVGFASGADFPDQYEQRAENFLANLQATRYYHILNQYSELTDTTHPVGPYTHFGGSVQDNTPPAANGNQISSKTIEAEITNEIQSNGWSSGPLDDRHRLHPGRL